MYGWTRVSKSLMSLASWSPISSLNLQSSWRLVLNKKYLRLSWAPCTSTPARVNHSTYSLSVSFFSWIMAFNAAIVFGCFLLTVKWEVNSLHNAFEELIESSSNPLNQVMAVPFNVKTNILHFTALHAGSSQGWYQCVPRARLDP